MSRLVGMHHGASDSAAWGVMGGRRGRRVSARSPLGRYLMGSPRQGRALAAAAAGQRVTHALAQRQPSPLGGTGVAVWGSADAEQFFFRAIILRAAAPMGALARVYPQVRRQGGFGGYARSSSPGVHWQSSLQRGCAHSTRVAGRMLHGASLQASLSIN